MIKKIYSKVKPSVILNITYSNELDLKSLEKTKYVPIADEGNFLQAISIAIPKDTLVKPHKHNPQERKTNQTHEAVLVLRGSVEVFIYDIDNKLVEKVILKEGDCSIILNGGHGIKTLEDSCLFEFKNGPYYGPEKDKSFINL